MFKLAQPASGRDSAKRSTPPEQSPSSKTQADSLPLPGADIWLHTPKTPKGFLSQQFIWLMTLVSLGLHGLVVMLPIPAEPPTEPAPPEAEQVRITQLPTGSPTATKPTPPTKASTQAQPKARPTNRPSTTPPIPTDKPKPPVDQTSPATSTPETTSASTSEVVGGNPWADFPQYPQAQPGCYNLSSCLQTDQTLGDVAAFFERELATKKYAAQPTINERQRKVYQVSRDGLTQFLSLIYVEGKGTLYVLSEAPRSITDLAQAIEVPAAVYNVLSNLYAENAGRDSFAQPDAFFTADGLRPEVGIIQLVTNEAFDTFFDTYFRNNLLNNGFESSDSYQEYGGGQLYTVTKEDLTLYITLVPTLDGTGTLVVVLKSLPE